MHISSFFSSLLPSSSVLTGAVSTLVLTLDVPGASDDFVSPKTSSSFVPIYC